jgi:hypothetical protein
MRHPRFFNFIRQGNKARQFWLKVAGHCRARLQIVTPLGDWEMPCLQIMPGLPSVIEPCEFAPKNAISDLSS